MNTNTKHKQTYTKTNKHKHIVRDRAPSPRFYRCGAKPM